MTPGSHNLYLVLGVGALAVSLLTIFSVTGSSGGIEKRLARVGPQEKRKRKIQTQDRISSVRSTKDSDNPFIDQLIGMLPNPQKLRSRLACTGKNITMGEYLLATVAGIIIVYIITLALKLDTIIQIPAALMTGLLIPHMVVGIMGSRRLKKFNANFPEAIDTMCRGIRSGLPITESIRAVGREMPDPIGIEFYRVSDAVRMGKTLEGAMWEVSTRINTPEFRFLIIAMAIQKETGGNLAETLGNLSELIRKRRQLRQKVKAMSSEAKASAMIIGSLPFAMFGILMIVDPDYVSILFHRVDGRFLLAGGIFWMSLGWGVMMKMIHFDI